MKMLQTYDKLGTSREQVFSQFIATLKPTIRTGEYFVNWAKIESSLEIVKKELHLLNALIGSSNIEKEFVALVQEYPQVVKALPLLIAAREKKIPMLTNINDSAITEFDFTLKTVNKNNAEKLLDFVKRTGIIAIFEDRKVKSLFDYVFGVEVGLDSNGRKNRSGTIMEDLVEERLKHMCHGKLTYLRHANSKRIQKEFGIIVTYEKSDRDFDFVIFDAKKKKITIIETNIYHNGGSKLKAVCGEFKNLENTLSTQGIDLVWITDGAGWHKAKRPLEETFNHNKYILNLHLVNKGALQEILK